MMYSKAQAVKLRQFFCDLESHVPVPAVVLLPPQCYRGPADSQLLAAARREWDEGMISVFRQLVLYQVTQYSTYDAKLAALLKKYKINFD